VLSKDFSNGRTKVLLPVTIPFVHIWEFVETPVQQDRQNPRQQVILLDMGELL
jgi:hypothetical protein